MHNRDDDDEEEEEKNVEKALSRMVIRNRLVVSWLGCKTKLITKGTNVTSKGRRRRFTSFINSLT